VASYSDMITKNFRI